MEQKDKPNDTLILISQLSNSITHVNVIYLAQFTMELQKVFYFHISICMLRPVNRLRCKNQCRSPLTYLETIINVYSCTVCKPFMSIYLSSLELKQYLFTLLYVENQLIFHRATWRADSEFVFEPEALFSVLTEDDGHKSTQNCGTQRHPAGQTGRRTRTMPPYSQAKQVRFLPEAG